MSPYVMRKKDTFVIYLFINKLEKPPHGHVKIYSIGFPLPVFYCDIWILHNSKGHAPSMSYSK